MLATILRTDAAASMSINIMRAFVTMRKYISTNLIEQKYINNLVLEDHDKLKVLEYSLNQLEDKRKDDDIYFILDNEIMYHCGTSINRIGYKTFSINIIGDRKVKRLLIDEINKIV